MILKWSVCKLLVILLEVLKMSNISFCVDSLKYVIFWYTAAMRNQRTRNLAVLLSRTLADKKLKSWARKRPSCFSCEEVPRPQPSRGSTYFLLAYSTTTLQFHPCPITIEVIASIICIFFSLFIYIFIYFLPLTYLALGDKLCMASVNWAYYWVVKT